MFDALREHCERETSLKKETLVARYGHARWQLAARHIILVLGLVVGFLILFFALENGASPMVLCSMAAAGLVLLAAKYARENVRWVTRIATFMRWCAANTRIKHQTDFLVAQKFLGGTLLLASLIALFWASCHTLGSTPPHSGSPKDEKDAINMLIGFAGALLGTQIALITFVVGNVVGRYSSRLAIEVVLHKAFLFLLSCPIVVIVTLGWIYFFGLSTSVTHFAAVVGVLLILCMIFTAHSSLKAISIEAAILYAGYRLARKTRTVVRKPCSLLEEPQPFLWRFLGAIGLDFRSMDRLFPVEAPERLVNQVHTYLLALINSSHKALVEGQSEVFSACLASITRVTEAYTDRRRLYGSRRDPIFRFLNDQLAGLVKASLKTTNESLLTEITTQIGNIGVFSFRIHGTSDPQTREQAPEFLDNHPIASQYYGLVHEAFLQGYRLQRSTAASRAIEQLQRLAVAGLVAGYPATIQLSFLSFVTKIHAACLQEFDDYRRILAGECFEALLKVWLFSQAYEPLKESTFQLNGHFCAAVAGMAGRQFELSQGRDVLMCDVDTVLTARLASDKPVIHDVVAAVVSRRKTDPWEYRIAAEALVKIMDLLAELEIASVKNRRDSDDFVKALYECSVLILLRLDAVPAALTGELAAAICQCIKKIFPLLFVNQRKSILEHTHEFVLGMIGIAIILNHKKRRQSLQNALESCVLRCLTCGQHILQSSETNDCQKEQVYSCLMLIGCWITRFLNQPTIASTFMDVLKTKGRFRPQRTGRSHEHAPLAALGYPLMFRRPESDFYLRVPQTISGISQEDLKILQAATEELMDTAALAQFAQRIPWA
jgi:hypothetical protein